MVTPVPWIFRPGLNAMPRESPRRDHQQHCRQQQQYRDSSHWEIKGWERVSGDVWKVTLPASFFGDFNPFADEIRGDWFDGRGRKHHTGAVYLNGNWLVEAAEKDDLFLPPGQKPAWLAGPDEYLLNVAWWRPEEPASSPAVSVDAIVDRQGTRNAPCEEGGKCVGFIRANDWILFDAADFAATVAR